MWASLGSAWFLFGRVHRLAPGSSADEPKCALRTCMERLVPGYFAVVGARYGVDALLVGRRHICDPPSGRHPGLRVKPPGGSELSRYGSEIFRRCCDDRARGRPRWRRCVAPAGPTGVGRGGELDSAPSHGVAWICVSGVLGGLVGRACGGGLSTVRRYVGGVHAAELSHAVALAASSLESIGVGAERCRGWSRERGSVAGFWVCQCRGRVHGVRGRRGPIAQWSSDLRSASCAPLILRASTTEASFCISVVAETMVVATMLECRGSRVAPRRSQDYSGRDGPSAGGRAQYIALPLLVGPSCSPLRALVVSVVPSLRGERARAPSSSQEGTVC